MADFKDTGERVMPVPWTRVIEVRSRWIADRLPPLDENASINRLFEKAILDMAAEGYVLTSWRLTSTVANNVQTDTVVAVFGLAELRVSEGTAAAFREMYRP